jgi:mRNA interferase MazF
VRRGEVWLADLEPIRGSEANKTRPAVIVSNEQANRRAATLGRGTVTIVPVTSNVARVLPFQVLLPAGEVGLPVVSKAQTEQVRSVDVSRLTRRLGQLPGALAADVDAALRLHLDL